MKCHIHFSVIFLEVRIVVQFDTHYSIEAHQDRAGLEIIEITINGLFAGAPAAIHFHRFIDGFLGKSVHTCKTNATEQSRARNAATVSPYEMIVHWPPSNSPVRCAPDPCPPNEFRANE